MIKKFFASLLIALGLIVSGAASAQFTQVIVFGDSLSDNGNMIAISGGTVPDPASQPFGIWSNGPVWTDVLETNTGLTVTNYAHGGALTGITNGENAVNPFGGTGSMYDASPFPGVMSQVLGYAQAVSTGAIAPDPGALFVVFAVANDFLMFQDQQTLGAWGASQGLNPADPGFATSLGLLVINTALINLTSANPIPYLGGAVTAPAGIIPLLYGLGARNIVVVNLPDLSLTPFILGAEQVAPGTQATFLSLVNNYNTFLAGALGSLKTSPSLSGINIIEVDASALLRELAADPTGFGFIDATTPALALLSQGAMINPDDYVFWDGVHPTGGTHAIIASEIMAAAEASLTPPQPVGVPVTIAADNGGSGAIGPLAGLMILMLLGLARRRPTIH